MSKIDDMANSVEKAANTPPPPPKEHKIHRRDGLSTSCTLLNLACTDNPFIGFVRGKYYLLVGDSASGKTFLAMAAFAEASINPTFKDYRLIYDNSEDGMLMNVEKLFGKEVARRLEAPRNGKDGEPIYSYTVEDFYYHLDDAVKHGKPFIYVMDSMDGLTSVDEVTKFDAHKRVARGTGKKGDEAGSYGTAKARINSEGLRKLMGKLRDSGSILIILSQTRDNIGFGFEEKTRSGGRALKFYATVEIWTSVTGQINKVIRGKPRSVGVRVELRLKKNRITGKTPKVQTSIYPSYGIDDIGTCVDYLVSEEWWKQEKGKQAIEAGEFDMVLSRSKLIQKIEEEGWEQELRAIVGKCWKEIEEASVPSRKGRYS